MYKSWISIVVAGLALTSSAGKVLTVGAAASLTNVMLDLQKKFERENPGIKLKMTFAGSGTIRMQIANGAPIDVFASANRNFGGSADYGSVLKTETVKIMCRNSLVFAVGKNYQADKSASLLSLLNAPTMKRIGIGNPAYVPAGKYAKKLLESKKIWSKTSGKMIQGSNVRQVLSWLEQGAVTGGFIYSTDAAMSDKLKIVKQYSTIAGQKLEYPVAVTKSSKNSKEALKFIAFLKSPQSQKTFTKYGFITGEK